MHVLPGDGLFRPFLEVGEVPLGGSGGERGQGGAAVGRDPDGDILQPADLAEVDVDLHDRGSCQDAASAAGEHSGAASEQDDQIGRLRGERQRTQRDCPASPQRVAGRQDPVALVHGEHRNVELLGEEAQFI